jgi:hypothetical protein
MMNGKRPAMVSMNLLVMQLMAVLTTGGERDLKEHAISSTIAIAVGGPTLV